MPEDCVPASCVLLRLRGTPGFWRYMARPSDSVARALSLRLKVLCSGIIALFFVLLRPVFSAERCKSRCYSSMASSSSSGFWQKSESSTVRSIRALLEAFPWVSLCITVKFMGIIPTPSSVNVRIIIVTKAQIFSIDSISIHLAICSINASATIRSLNVLVEFVLTFVLVSA